MKRLVLSPHNDDAVLSLGGHIAKWIEAGDDVLVLNIFTVSSYVNPATRKNPQDVTAARANEEGEASRILGYRFKQLGFYDKPLRNGIEAATINDRVRHSLDCEYKAFAPDRVYAPMSGRHEDHRITRDNSPGFPGCSYYEDLPYCMGMFPPDGKNPALTEIDINQKIEALRKYATQIDGIIEYLARGYAHSMENDRYYERVWE